MYDNDHLDEQWLRQTPPPRRRSGAGCGLTLLLVLLLVLRKPIEQADKTEEVAP